MVVVESCGMFRDAIDYIKPFVLGASGSGCSVSNFPLIGNFFWSY